MRFLATVLVLLPGLVLGITVHEASHALTAKWLGDHYAQRMGRISLNPFRHLSLWGTLALFVLGFGWGKPVPVNLYNFKRPKFDYFLCSIAGPASNLLLCAIILGLLFLKPGRLIEAILIPIFLINAVLAVINLLPIPPLDGSKIWPCIIPGMRPEVSGKWSMVWVAVLIVALYSGAIDKVILPVMNQMNQILSNVSNYSPRPEGFPEVLIAPQGAFKKHHYVYPDDGNEPNEFCLSFVIKEHYPAANLISFLEQDLTQHQFHPLAYQLSDSNLPANAHWALEIDKPELDHWQKGWINRQGEFLIVTIEFLPKNAIKELSQKAIVNIELYKSFPEFEYLLEYRSKHPEELEHNN